MWYCYELKVCTVYILYYNWKSVMLFLSKVLFLPYQLFKSSFQIALIVYLGKKYQDK